MHKLDKKNTIILEELQKNCRISLTKLSEKVGLSIDSVKKRIEKMENYLYYPKIQIRPRSLGFNNIIDIKITLNSHTNEEKERFVAFLMDHPRVAEIFSVSGEYDMSIVIVSKDSEDQEKITTDIKNRFGNIIQSWVESMTLKVYKFETYDIKKLME